MNPRYRRILPTALLCRAALWSPVVLPATDYFVSSSTGHDNNPGTSALPWQTLQSHIASLSPGDTLNIESGTYSGFILGWDPDGTYGVLAGNAAQPITIRAATGTPAVNVVITNKNNKTQYGVDLEPGCGFIVISNITVDGSSGGFSKYPNRGGGIKIAGSHDCRVISCQVQNVDYGFGILADNATNLLLRANMINNTGAHGNGNYGHGLYLSGSTTGAIVDGNVIHDNAYIGIHINGDISEGGLGLVTASLIMNNRIFSNGQNAINADGLQGSVIENNVIFNYQNFGICLYQIDAAEGCKSNVIVNNTISSGTNAATGAVLRILDASTGNTVFNNVLLSSGGNAYRISADSLAGLASDYNVLDVGVRIQSEDDGSEQSFVQWQGQGYDAHSLTSVPAQLFLNQVASDFHLLPSSLAINAGTNLLAGGRAPMFDCDWAARPQGTGWDVGAYEYGSAAGTAITQTITGTSLNADGSLTIHCAAIPLCPYQVQATTNLSLPPGWQTIAEIRTGLSGLWQFTDTNAASIPTRFYRTTSP